MSRAGKVVPFGPLDRDMEDGGAALLANRAVAALRQSPASSAMSSGSSLRSLSLPRDGKAPRATMGNGGEAGVELTVSPAGGASKWPTRPLGAVARFKTLASAHPALQGINLEQLPVAIRQKLEALDANGDGHIDVEELIAAVAHMDRRDMKYDLSSFPEAIREDLKIFDQDGDGTVSADEVARACAMYKNAQRKLKMAGRTVVGLVILILCALGLNAGLTVAVTNLTQDYKLANDGVMRNKETNNVVATGKVTDAFLFVADADCYNKIRGRHGTSIGQPDLLAMKPEMMTVVLSDRSTRKEHNVTFPVDFMRIEDTWARLGSVQLGYAVKLRVEALPEFSFNSWERNPGASLSAAEDDEIGKMVVDMITVYSSKDELKPYGGSLEQFTNTRAYKLTEEPASGTANTVEAFREVDAKQAGAAAAAALLRLPVEDTSDEIKADPKSSLVRSEPTAWMVLLNHATADATFNDDRYLEFCGVLVVRYNGMCACRVNETTTVCSREEAVAFNQFQITIREDDLNDMLGDQDMLLSNNKYGIAQISKIFAGSGPSVNRWGLHTGDEGQEAHVEGHATRRRQLREAVFSTHKGRMLSAALRRRAALEELHAARLGARRAVAPREGRALKQEAAGGLDWYLDNMIHGSTSCYFSGRMYRGNESTVTYTNSNGMELYGWCKPWAPEEIQQYNVSYLPEECMAPPANRFRVNQACSSCRHVPGKEEPHCMIETQAGRRLERCNVRHCMQVLQEDIGHNLPQLEYDDGPWGLDRIRNSRELGAYNESYNPADDNQALKGRGVHCYIVDTGVNLDHTEFRGRSGRSFNAIDHSSNAADDQGHGTHVAAIVAGRTVGVAPGCIIHAVKVLNRNNKFVTSVHGSSAFNGLQWVLRHYNELKASEAEAGRPAPRAVVNLSVVSRKSEIWENAVNELHKAGVVVVAAAGNNDDDACQHSPATQINAITVGATSMDDSKSIYSNWGACVQIYAPGNGIRSASHLSNNGFLYMSGTSQAAPFVTGAVALFLQAHPQATPRSAARFITNLASSGMVHGVDSRLADYKQFGYHSTHWADFVDWAEDQHDGYNANDESANVDPYDNKLLFIGHNDLGLDLSSTNGTLPLCRPDDDTQWGAWDLDASHCPRAAALCGSSETVLHPPWVDAPGTVLPSPVLKRTRACNATTCVCTEEYDYGVLLCKAPAGEEYEFLQGCGLSAAVLRTRQHVDWLQDKWLRFTPQDSTGEFYDVCQVHNEPRPIASSCQILDNVQSATHMFSSNVRGAGKASLNGRFHFWSQRLGRMMPYDAVFFYANGHIGFVPPSGGTAFLPASDAYSLEAHFSAEKGAGISALFHPMSFSGCRHTGAEDCGELRIYHDHKTKRFVLSYLNVISAFAPFDQPEYRSTFQIVLWLEGSAHPAGTFDLIYYKVSQLAQGNAVYGVANGEPYNPAYVISPRQSAAQTCRATGAR